MTTGMKGHPRRWTILGVLCLALFAVSLDNTILNVALPTLAREFNAGTSELQWMVDAYVLVFAGLLLVSGALSDRFGRRLLLVIGLGIFGVGSITAPFVTSSMQLIALRAAMGVGAALAMPSTLSIIADVFTDEERPKAIAAWGAISAIGMVVGPTLGGYLVEHFAWNSVFLVNIPFVVTGIVLTLLLVPESKAPEKLALDPIGAVLSIGMLVTLVYGIIEIPSKGITDPVTAGVLAAAAVLGTAFVAWELHSKTPMLDVRIFRNLRFTAASVSISLTFFALMGVMFFISQYLQGVQGLSPFQAGLRFIAVVVGMIPAAMISPKLTARVGTRYVVAAGLAMVAGSLVLVSQLGVNASDPQIGATLALLAFGMGTAMLPATDSIMGALPPEKFGVGSAVNDTTREIGASLGIAILGSVFSGVYSSGMSSIAAMVPAPYDEMVKSSFAGALALASQAGGTQGAMLASAAKAAFVDGMGTAALVGAGFAFAGALVSLVFLPNRPKARAVTTLDAELADERPGTARTSEGAA